MLGLEGVSTAVIERPRGPLADGVLGASSWAWPRPWPPASSPPAPGMRFTFSCSSSSFSYGPRARWEDGSGPASLRPLAHLRRGGRTIAAFMDHDYYYTLLASSASTPCWWSDSTCFWLRRPDLFRARRLLRPGGLHLRHPHRHLRRRSWLALVAGLQSRPGRLFDRRSSPEATGLLPGRRHLGFGIIVYIILNEAQGLAGKPWAQRRPIAFPGRLRLQRPPAPSLLISIILGLILYVSANLVNSRTGRAIPASTPARPGPSPWGWTPSA